MDISLLTFLVLIAAFVSALNPYTIGVLILLCSAVYGSGRAPRHVLGLGLTYVLTLFGASLLGGIVLLWLLSHLPELAVSYLTLGIGILIVYAGLLEIKDFLWYGRGLSAGMSQLAARTVRRLTKKRPGLWSAAALGLFVAVISSTSSSAPYIASIAALQNHFDATGLGLLTLYSGIFVFPMLILLVLVANGVRVSTLQRWKEEAKGKMRLSVGLLLIALGWILILTTSGIVSLE